MFEPEVIKITDETNALLVTLCDVTGLGKSGVVDSAIRLLVNRFIDECPDAVRIIEESKKNRSFAETVNDILHNAIDQNKQSDKK